MGITPSPGERQLQTLIDAPARKVGMQEVLRYAKGASRIDVQLDDHLNFHFLSHPGAEEAKRMLLESGINQSASVTAVEGERRPAILLGSSPWKAGHETNPWEDVYDLNHGHVRYFGDHKANKSGPVGVTPGNRALLDAWSLQASPRRDDRLVAPPLLLFRAVPVVDPDGMRRQKGYVEFCGLGVMERLEMVVQRDPRSGQTFPNLVVDLVVVGLSDDETFDWRWVDARRDPALSAEHALALAPPSWQRWVNEGKASLSRIRRRVLSSRVKSGADQRPVPGTREDAVLTQIYRHFDGRKHAFEHLSATIAAQVFEASGARYHRGWLTRAGGDGAWTSWAAWMREARRPTLRLSSSAKPSASSPIRLSPLTRWRGWLRDCGGGGSGSS